MTARLSPIIALGLLASTALADGLSIEKTYRIYAQDRSKKDAACLSAFTNNIAPEFRGLTGLQLSGTNIHSIRSGTLATYANATFLSVYGDEQGTINCIFSKTRETPTDVSVTFNGEGLAGFEKRGRISQSSDPADWKVAGFSSSVAP